MNSACNCCDDPPCPTPTLEFLSISGLPGTCGYLAGAGDSVGSSIIGFQSTTGLPEPAYRKIYGRIVVTITAAGVGSGSGGYGFDEYTDYYATTDVLTAVRTPDGEDCITQSLTGTATWSQGYTGTYVDPGDGDYLISYDRVGSATIVSGAWSLGTSTQTSVSALSGSTTTATGQLLNAITCDEGEGCPSVSWSGSTWTAVYSNGSVVIQYLDLPALIFPEWHTWDTPPEEWLDGQGDLDYAQKTDDKVEVRVKWRVKNLPSGTCYLRVWIKKTFTPFPDPDAPPGTPAPPQVITILDPVEWSGTGNPCFEFPLLGAGHADNTIHTPEVLNPDPSMAGTDEFEIHKWACVRDYVPEIGNAAKPNGYPNPA